MESRNCRLISRCKNASLWISSPSGDFTRWVVPDSSAQGKEVEFEIVLGNEQKKKWAALASCPGGEWGCGDEKLKMTWLKRSRRPSPLRLVQATASRNPQRSYGCSPLEISRATTNRYCLDSLLCTESPRWWGEVQPLQNIFAHVVYLFCFICPEKSCWIRTMRVPCGVFISVSHHSIPLYE